jgi:hypothetical protein
MTVMIENLYIWRFEAAGAPKVRVMIWGGAFWTASSMGLVGVIMSTYVLFICAMRDLHQPPAGRAGGW